MAFFSTDFDIRVSIYRVVNDTPSVGLASRYADKEFPSTDKKIQGFHFDQKKWKEEGLDNEANVISVLWDPSSAGLKNLELAGIGDGNDLKVIKISRDEEDFISKWKPCVEHGYYYNNGEEFYLHSDDVRTQYPTYSGLVVSGANFIVLDETPKQGIPIVAETYEWDDAIGIYRPLTTYQQVVEFTGKYFADGQHIAQDSNLIFWEFVNSGVNEFTIDGSSLPPTLIFNKQVSEIVGVEYGATISGLNGDQLDQLDNIGITNGSVFQELHLKYSPVDSSMNVHIWSNLNNSFYVKYDVVDEFTLSGINEVKVDYDLGIVKFGSTEYGGLPVSSSDVYATYWKTVAVQYEPQYTRDCTEPAEADMNPIRRYSGNGFVFIRNQSLDVASLVLSAELSEIGTNLFGPLYLGNNFANVIATAKSSSGEVIEDQVVTFEILTSTAANFNGDYEASAITNSNGQAKTLLNPPRSIEDIGGVTADAITVGSGTSLFLDNYFPPFETSPIFLFQVAKEDHVLGVPKSGLQLFYENYLTDEALLGGPALDWNIDLTNNYAWLGSALEDLIKWEVWHRTVHDLAVPIVYEDSDLRTGKKTVVATLDVDAINPHTGTTPAFVPVQPSGLIILSSGTNVIFEESLDPITPSSIHKSYLLVGPTKVQVRAKTINRRTGQTIYSNTIDVLIDIPDSHKGLFAIDTVNALPSGVLTNARFYDQKNITLEGVELTTSGLLPLGWRLRSPGVTLASALDSITFFDLNPLPQSYNDENITTSGELLVNLKHKFEVTI